MAHDEPHDPDTIDDVDNPELTEADFTRAVPFARLFPEQAASLKRQGGRPKLDRPKVKVAWRLAADVVDAVKASGEVRDQTGKPCVALGSSRERTK